jgi:hypothetical protein
MEKKLRQTIIPFFTVIILVNNLWSCNGNKTSSGNFVANSIEKNSAEKERITHSEGFSVVIKGDSIYQKAYEDGKLHFESLLIKGNRIYNHIYPEISDAFLFEDKFYLKISYPIPFSGNIKTVLPDCPDYVLTPIGEDILQVVIYNALDLETIDFEFTYIPSAKDSLVPSSYPYKYVAFE